MRRRTPFSRLSRAPDTSDPLPYSCACILVCSLTRLSRSLRRNGLDAKAAEHLAAGLKENKALQKLECAAARRFLDCQ